MNHIILTFSIGGALINRSAISLIEIIIQGIGSSVYHIRLQMFAPEHKKLEVNHAFILLFEDM